MQLEYSEWGSQVGDEAAETSMNLIMQGHTGVLCLVVRVMGNPGRHLRRGFSFVRKDPSGISVAMVEMRASMNDLW